MYVVLSWLTLDAGAAAVPEGGWPERPLHLCMESGVAGGVAVVVFLLKNNCSLGAWSKGEILQRHFSGKNKETIERKQILELQEPGFKSEFSLSLPGIP